MHVCIKCFVQNRIEAVMTHGHPSHRDLRVQDTVVEPEEPAERQAPPLIHSGIYPPSQVSSQPVAEPGESEQRLCEEDLTTLDKIRLNSAYSAMVQIQDAVTAREGYEHFYEGLAEKTRQRGQDILTEASERKWSL